MGILCGGAFNTHATADSQWDRQKQHLAKHGIESYMAPTADRSGTCR